MATIQHLDQQNFDAFIQSETPVLVDFFATWCGPCKMLSPILEELAGEYDGKLSIGKVDVDEQTEIATRYGVMSMPTLLLFKNGEVVMQHIGLAPKAELARKLAPAL